MTLPLPLLVAAACADWLITLRPLQTIARLFEVETGQLEKAVAGGVAPLTSRGQLQSALQSLENRPELLPHKTHLARLEHQLALLARQFDRAEADVERIQNRPEGCDFNELRKAELFANRIHQQTVRLLKEIQKTQLLIDRAASDPAANEPAASEPATNTGKSPARARKTAAPLADTVPIMELPIAEAPIVPAPIVAVSCDAPRPAESAAARLPVARPAHPAEPIPKLDPPPNAKEFRLCLSQHRRQINSVPPNERQALMERLIAKTRANREAAA